MKKYGFIIILIVIFFILSSFFAAAKIVNPQETDELLKNPGKGWMTMYEAAIHDPTLPDDIPSTLFYHRPSWDHIHIGPNQYNWPRLDSAIANAQAGGQQIMLRFMPVSSGASSPEFLKNMGANGWDCDGGWHADLDDPLVREHVSLFLEALAERYDNHPGFHSIEINFLGCWGEGNNACGCPVEILGTEETQKWLMEEHYKYFQKLPIIGPVDTPNSQYTAKYMVEKYGDTRGAGIFMDCWGDYNLFGEDWSHMEDGYPSWLNQIHGGSEWDSWKRGIWKLEPCGVMSDWDPIDVQPALQWALDNHATFMGNKDANIPSENMDDVKETLKKLGYRLVLRQLEHPDSVGVGENLNLQLELDNIGVAPPYRDYYLAVRLKQGSTIEKIISNTSVKFWLPGLHNIELSVPVPSSLSSGSYDLAIGIVSPYTDEPILLMPIQGRESSGWHPLSTITIGQGTICADNDNDRYGNPASTTCTYPELDCDDNNADINPGATETCGNGIDEDCNGQDLSCLLADLNQDGQVNLGDFIQLITRWLRTSNITNEDINNDNRVDTRDLGIMMSGWGQ